MKVRTVARSATFAVLALLALTVGTGLAQPPAPQNEENNLYFQAPWGEILGTGAKRPSPDQWAWGEAHMVKTRGVKPNQIGLLRLNEARRRRGERPLTPQEVGLVPLGREAEGGGAEALAEPSATPLEVPAVDNSTLKYFPPIRSQGSLGSCAQFSAVYYTLPHMTAMARDWDAKNWGDSYRFSPKWTYN
ncbi:MAG: hypothetical protein N2255_03655, partial [Kiritimatiellae bacterium]|nr:hypothetical protein [Kiritimatiellia bacterium]